MPNAKNRLQIFKSSYLQVAGILLLIIFAALMMWFNHVNSTQAISATVAKVRFYGEYRIGDRQWQEITEGQHIPATKGDVTLRGNFHMLTPDGEYVGVYRGELPVAFYSNHISLTIYEGSNEPFVMDIENPLYGSSACCKYWTGYMLSSGSEESIEILIHNPHRFGNENAIDEMLSNMSLWSGIDFESDVLDSGQTQRNIGLFFVIVSLALLGSALFSALLQCSQYSDYLASRRNDFVCRHLFGIQCSRRIFLERIRSCEHEHSWFFHDVLYAVRLGNHHLFPERDKTNRLYCDYCLRCFNRHILCSARVDGCVFL